MYSFKRLFPSRVKWLFSFFVISFLPEIFYYANLVTNDIVGFASRVVWRKIKNISAKNEAMLLKIGRDVATLNKIYQIVHSLMLLWQHARLQSLSLQNQILPFVAARGLKLKILKGWPNEGGTGIGLRKDQVFCLVESQHQNMHHLVDGTQGIGLRFPCNDRTDEVNKWCIQKRGCC